MCKKLRNAKNDGTIQQKITSENKQLKKLMKEKEKEYKLNIVNDMNFTGKNPKNIFGNF